MLPTLWQIVWRAGLLIAILNLGTFAVNRFPASQAEKAEQEYNEILKSLLDNSDLKKTLRDTSLTKLTVRDRNRLDEYLRQARYGKGVAERKLNLMKKEVNYGIEVPLNEFFYANLKSAVEPVKVIQKDSVRLYQEILNVLTYFEANLSTLYNLLYYDPKLEVKAYEDSHNNEILLQSYGAARYGLQKTVERLDSLPNFSDPTAKNYNSEISGLADKAGEISDTAIRNESKSYGLAKVFSEQVYTLQAKILNDRQKFWGEYGGKDKLINELDNLEKKASPVQNQFLLEIAKIRTLN